MKVKNISMEWKPAEIPETGFLGDGIYAQGTLRKKDGRPVYFKIKGVGGFSLQRAIFTLGAGPEAPDWAFLKYIMWEFDYKVDADILELDVFDANYPHTVLVNDKAFLIDVGIDTWKGYNIKLPAEFPIPLVVGGLGILGLVLAFTKRRRS